ncbi:MAG: hypothetical protein P8N24_01380 [Hellea sp.]|nr:hypothetical protein [Hellea sp.]
MLESSIHPTKWEVLVWEVEDIIEELKVVKGHEGNLVAATTISLLQTAIKKSEETHNG